MGGSKFEEWYAFNKIQYPLFKGNLPSSIPIRMNNNYVRKWCSIIINPFKGTKVFNYEGVVKVAHGNIQLYSQAKC